MCIYIYIMYASGQDAQGHLWHGSDWTATNQSGFHTSGLSCKLDTFSKPRLRKMLFSASECCSNRMAPTSSSFEGKSLKKKMTWMVENRNQKHEESILIILRNRKQLTSLVFSLSPFALDFKGRQSQNLSASGLRLSSSSTPWTLSNHSPVGPFSWTHRISTLLWTWAAFKARKAQCRFSSQPLSTRTSVSILSKTLRLSVIRQPGMAFTLTAIHCSDIGSRLQCPSFQKAGSGRSNRAGLHHSLPPLLRPLRVIYTFSQPFVMTILSMKCPHSFLQ